MILQHSAQATLTPNKTYELPEEMDNLGGKCFIFDAYPSALFGIMTVIKVFRSEMESAQLDGGGQLIQKLKDGGYYPYSDLNREAVV